MYHDRVLRGNTYAILKNVNRNIDTHIKPPTLRQTNTSEQQVLLSVSESVLWSKTAIFPLLGLWRDVPTLLFKRMSMSRPWLTNFPHRVWKLRRIFILIDLRIDSLCPRSREWIKRPRFLIKILIYLILTRRYSLFAMSYYRKFWNKAEWKWIFDLGLGGGRAKTHEIIITWFSLKN